MLKLKAKKGVTLVEVLCAFGLFSILFVSTLDIQGNILKLEQNTQRRENMVQVMEAVKQEICYNLPYEKVAQYNINSFCYLPKEKASLDVLQAENLENVLRLPKPPLFPYIEIEIQKEGGVFHVFLKGYIKEGIVEESLSCDFYKGKSL